MIEMSREEAIGRIQEHRRIHSKKEPFTPYLDEAFDMAIEALQDTESLAKTVIEASELLRKRKAKQEWIPCSERLPEERKLVIVCDDNGNVFEYTIHPIDIVKYAVEGKWSFLDRSIIAWMPMPEPYKQEDEHGS